MMKSLVLGIGLLATSLELSDAASYRNFKNLAKSSQAARVNAKVPPLPRTGAAGTVRNPLTSEEDNAACSPFNTCTSCTENEGCAWCKNLNECVAELGSVETCSVAGRRSEGLFAPIESDHVAATGSGIGKGTCGFIINPASGLYHVHPDQPIVVR